MAEHALIPNFDEVLSELEHSSDRVCAIVAGSLVDTFLEIALRSRLMSLDKDMSERIFGSGTGSGGPLSNVAGKIDMGFALGLYPQDHRADLILVNRIRNRFAHDFHVRNFENPVIESLLSKLKLTRELNQGREPEEGRGLFMNVATYLIAVLSQVAHDEIVPPALSPWFDE